MGVRKGGKGSSPLPLAGSLGSTPGPTASYVFICLRAKLLHTHTRAHTHMHTHTLLHAPETSPPVLRDPRSAPKAPLTQDLPLSGPRGLVMARQAEHGEGKRRALGLPPPTPVGRSVSLSLSFLSWKMGSPHGLAYPRPQVQGQTRETGRRFWKRGSTGRWWWEGS